MSGRQCRGYQPAPVGTISWQQLLRRPCLFVDESEVRCLSYYHRVVAPSLARSPDDTFWAVHVPQVLDREPAARHAVLAIGALHEGFDATLLKRASSVLYGLTGLTGRSDMSADVSAACAFALQHYNSAIRIVLEDRISSEEALLTVSLLFTCIELLQGSTDAAATHCQHGLGLYANDQLPAQLSAVFGHISIFRRLFNPLNLTDSVSPQADPCPTPVGEMCTVAEARQALDAVMARGARLVRLAPGNWDGDDSYSIQDARTEQFHVCRALSLWWQGFVALRRRLSSTSSVLESDAAELRLLETRWLASDVLARSCLAGNEALLDEYLDHFRRIVELAEQERAARSASGMRPPSFSFDMGYLPFLYIVSLRCRQLRLRIRALVLLKALSCSRETIWDACIAYATAKRVVEFEHGLSLDEERMRSASNPYPDKHLPYDAQRIVRFDLADEASLEADSEGRALVRRRICFHSSGPDGVVVGPSWEYTTMRL